MAMCIAENPAEVCVLDHKILVINVT